MEDASSKSKEYLANMAEQLAVSTQQKQAAEAEIEKKDAHIKSISNISTKHKQNSEALSKKNMQLEKLYDSTRKEVERLESKLSDLEMSSEQEKEEMTAEIESLESMLDTARDEAATLNEELQELRFSLSAKTQEKENLQNSYNELHFAKEEMVDKLENQVAMLRARAEKAENELGDKAGRFDSMEADLAMYKEKMVNYEAETEEAARVKKEYDKMKKDYDKLNEADKDRRRKARETKKKEEENERKRLADLANRPKPRSPEQKLLEKKNHKREPSPKQIRDKQRRQQAKKAYDAQVEEGGGVPVEKKATKYVPHKRQRGKCRSSPVSTPNTSGVIKSENDSGDEEGEKVMSDLPPLPSVAPLKRGASNRSTILAANNVQPVTISNGLVVAKSPVLLSRSASPTSSRDIYSSGGVEFPLTEVSEAGGGIVELSPVLSFLRDEPQQMTLRYDDDEDIPGGDNESMTGGEGSLEGSLEGSVDFSVSYQSSVSNYDFGTNQSMAYRLKKACKKLITQKRLASDIGVTDTFADSVLKVVAKLNDDDEDNDLLLSSDDEIKASSSQIHGSSDLHDLVAANMNILPQSSEEMSLCSDINCEQHDVSGELSEEVAKIIGSTLKDVHYALEEKLTAKETAQAMEMIAPKLMELSSITAKAQIGLWRAMKSTKQQTDFICKLAATCEKMIPFWGSDPSQMDIDDMADLHAKIASLEYFDQFREKWMKAVDLDRNMMKKLSEKEWNEHLFVFADLPSSCHFDHDEDREHSFDVALNAMIVMENFTEKMSGGVENLLTSLFLDWATIKMGLLEGGGFGSGGSEAQKSKIAAIQKEMDILRENFTNLTQEKDELLEKITQLEPDAVRCKEVVTMHEELDKEHQGLVVDNNNLLQKHSSLKATHKKLETDHKKANELIEKLKRELKTTQDVLGTTQTNLDERNAIQGAMQAELDDAREKERIRLYGLISSEMQTDPFIVDVACQTEFIVPPMSLHHTMSSNISRSTPASSKRSFYPIVTPGGPSKGFMASLHDEFANPENRSTSSNTDSFTNDGFSHSDGDFLDRDKDYNSATSALTMSLHDDGTLMSNSLMDTSEYLDDKERAVLTPILSHRENDPFSTSRPGSKASKRSFNDGIRMLNKISAAQSNKNVDVGLPSIQTMYSEASSDGGSQTASVPQPLSGKLSPIKYVKPTSGPMWGASDTIRMQPRQPLTRSRSTGGTAAISAMLEAHRRNQAPAYRKDLRHESR